MRLSEDLSTALEVAARRKHKGNLSALVKAWLRDRAEAEGLLSLERRALMLELQATVDLLGLEETIGTLLAARRSRLMEVAS